ncbi:unnamed protein product [Urochloa humidicola]
MEDYKYLVKFPSHKKVESIVLGKATYFYLKGDSVLASIRVWNGDIEPVGHLTEAWVVIKGVPPKWADWITIKEIASSLGKLLEVDWHTLFASFFSVIRVKINCKEPKSIPKQRVVELDGQLYLLTYTAEDVEQETGESGGSEGGEDPDNEDEESPDSETKDKETRKSDNNEEAVDKGGTGKPREENGTSEQFKQNNTKGSSQREQSVRKAFNNLNLLQEEEAKINGEVPGCVNLLQAMELSDTDTEEGEELGKEKEDEELSFLPEEWTQPDVDLFDRQDLRLLHDHDQMKTEEQQVENNKAGKKKRVTTTKQWGPIVVERESRRNKNDTRTALEKAQDIKRKWREDHSQEFGGTYDKDREAGTGLDDPMPCRQTRRAINLFSGADAKGKKPGEVKEWVNSEDNCQEAMGSWTKQMQDLDRALTMEEASCLGWSSTEVVI